MNLNDSSNLDDGEDDDDLVRINKSKSGSYQQFLKAKNLIRKKNSFYRHSNGSERILKVEPIDNTNIRTGNFKKLFFKVNGLKERNLCTLNSLRKIEIWWILGLFEEKKKFI